jgi:hypothetical protein
LGEARVQALVAYSAFGDSRLVSKAILESAADDDAATLILDEEAAWILLVWEYYMHTGDRRLLQQLYPRVRACLSRLRGALNEHGVLSLDVVEGRAAAVFVDEVELDRRGEVTSANAFYHRALLTAARIAGSVADLPARREFEHRALALRNAINWRMWSRSDAAYADCRTRAGLGRRMSDETNWLAIAFGIADPERAQAIRARLDGREGVGSEPSPFFQCYVLEALYTLGDDAAAIERIRRLWGGMLGAGADAWWQHWPQRPEPGSVPPGSLCWAPAASPTHFLTTEVAGMRPTAAGWRRARVQPSLGGLEWLRGTAPTPLGDLVVESRRHGDRAVDLQVSIPAGMRAELGLAEISPEDVVEWEGRIIWPTAQAHRGLALESPPQWTQGRWSWLVAGPREIRLRLRG